MASPDRTTAYAVELFEALRRAPYAFHFFQALRRLECWRRIWPRQDLPGRRRFWKAPKAGLPLPALMRILLL